jgi:hypothetical protein
MAVTNSNRVPFGTPGTGKGVARRAERGRLCADPACSTVLSTYNTSATCYLHTVATYTHPLYRS